MAKDVLLALALDFKDAPQELKDAAKAYQDAWLASEKAKVQIAAWIAKGLEADSEMFANERVFKKMLQAWDPSGSKDPKPEQAEAKAVAK